MSNKKVSNEGKMSRSELFKILRKQLSTKKIIDYEEIPTSNIFKPHFETVTKLINDTLTNGESNSLFIVGPRGSGKSTLINSAFNYFENQNINLRIVNLNGLIHTDDNIALKDIARQLNLSNVINDEKVTGSFAENMSLILETLKSNDNNGTLIFSIEEFDLFSQHKNQTLLYNLFDSALNSETPIVIFGITCRLDVLELLEKRVKSRFSHRQLYLFANLTFEDYMATAKHWLKLRENTPNSILKENWNNFVEELFQDEHFLTLLKEKFDFSPDFTSLQKLLFPIIGQLSIDMKISSTNLLPKNIKIPKQLVENNENDSKETVICSLSQLELTLVIVMMKHSSIHEGEPFNLRTINENYKKLVQNDKTGSGMREFPKAVVSKAYENMERLELIIPVENSSILSTTFKGQKDYRSMRLTLQPNQLREALKIYPSLPAQLQQFAANLEF